MPTANAQFSSADTRFAAMSQLQTPTAEARNVSLKRSSLCAIASRACLSFRTNRRNRTAIVAAETTRKPHAIRTMVIEDPQTITDRIWPRDRWWSLPQHPVQTKSTECRDLSQPAPHGSDRKDLVSGSYYGRLPVSHTRGGWNENAVVRIANAPSVTALGIALRGFRRAGE